MPLDAALSLATQRRLPIRRLGASPCPVPPHICPSNGSALNFPTTQSMARQQTTCSTGQVRGDTKALRTQHFFLSQHRQRAHVPRGYTLECHVRVYSVLQLY
jgi:transposase InsO family protein